MTKSITEALKQNLEVESTLITPSQSTAEEQAAKAAVEFDAMEKSPADWYIVPNDDESITATHRTTRKVFVGTVAEFSQALK